MKCAKSQQFLEDLPSEILVHILSFMTLKEAGRTSVLSKNWVGLWRFVVQLDFEPSKDSEYIVGTPLFNEMRGQYVEWVNKVLQSHKGFRIDKFRICFELNRFFQDDIDKWVHYAFSRRVERLELNLLDKGCPMYATQEHYHYNFPTRLLLDDNSNGSDESSIHHFAGFHQYYNLRSLRLGSVNVTGEDIHLFLNKSPFLEHLTVQGSCSKDMLSVVVLGPSLALKHLEITYCQYLQSIIVRDAPHLISINFTRVSNLVLENVPRLVDVCVSEWLFREIIPKLKTSCLSRVEVLSLSLAHDDLVDIEVSTSRHGLRLSSFLSNGILFWFHHKSQGKTRVLDVPQLTAVKQLIVYVNPWRDNDFIHLSSYLINLSPNLEKFVLKIFWNVDLLVNNKGLPSNKQFPRGIEEIVSGDRRRCRPLVSKHLKVFEFRGYLGRKTNDKLVRYFLKNATALERIIVDPRDQLVFDALYESSRYPGTEKFARNAAETKLRRLMPSSVEFLIP
ncbi:OLC1v1029493C1 [Oldenlandia corymbosa var. corymbosa]|uniref:OLC1v1029493C1 n=1 Tax=Oldenlandia corymbosa var. corymbosa TaxID=529605 RepID=A0AAV1CES9_OLDCO|nr:OLC1v1029493C1 [Oldenlandia corymbosa var. corymbosa]